MNVSGADEAVGKDEYVIPSIRLDEIIKEDMLLLKVDVECKKIVLFFV